DSSCRFERGVDPNGVLKALDRTTALILEVAGGQLAKGVGVVSTQNLKPLKISFRPSWANALLGTQIAPKAQIQILKALGCKIKGTPSSKTLTIVGPSYRLDLTREIDLIEEIARLSGYDHIPVVAPRIPSDLTPIESNMPFEKEIRSILHQAGFYEAVN